MANKSDILLMQLYLIIIIVVIGGSIAYALSGILPDTPHALLAFILLTSMNCVSLFVGYKIIVRVFEYSRTSEKFVFFAFTLILPLILMDISASILIPEMAVSGFPVRTISMGLLFILLLIVVGLLPTIEFRQKNESE